MSPEASSNSNIRVFIRWHDQTVFAGEEIKCTITFKNIARDSSQQRQSQLLTPTDRSRHASPLLRAKSNAGLTPPNSAQTRGHRSALSLNVPAAQARKRSGSVPWPSPLTPNAAEHRGNGHQKSVSIVSIGSTSTIADETQSNASSTKSQRPGRGHARASSLQIVPRGAALGLAGPHSAVRPKEGIPTIINEHTAPAMRILSTTSMGGGTPRSSGEFYSMSNNSTETLASEYPSQPTRGPMRPPHFRRPSNLAHNPKLPESLMMGYAQIQGSFTLDGSLINIGPFEQVKRKAVVGGQGGGVIGVEPSKRDSGLLRSFGWGSISNSIGELLGGGELSSIKDMRGIASSKSVPLLSTPQSILFVDLNLAPGEHKAFEYSFQLPKGLPPTHKGKAVKISYSLVIGTQRAGGSKEQQVRSVEIPFRVLGSVNSYGEILGHDLMNPYIILRDQAKIKTVDKLTTLGELKKLKATKPDTSTINDFLSYVDELISRPRDGSSTGLLSPTAYPGSRRSSAFEDATTATEAINMAIMRSNITSEGQQSPNRFEIARNGQRVGVVMLTRPSYRLGEVVTMAIDFTDADIPCYAVHSCLESAERIEPHLAIRSEASIHRVTRRIHVAASEATLYNRRMVFTPTIPINATPEFVTTGVSLEWKIRVEFVVPSQETELERESPSTHPLLEEISRDEKGGLVLVAVENLACESFEVAVPLRVYGAVATGLERLERDEAFEEGLVV
ncbi:Protein sat1 [Colletotrichum sp. SAR11_240]|nr:Protein sat1 [Colletotrichum sp. SAR11_240]